MGFLNFLGIGLKGRKEFEEEHASTIRIWKREILQLCVLPDDAWGWGWPFGETPEKYKTEFEKDYSHVMNYLDKSIKSFIEEHSDGYNKKDINEIYLELVEEAKRHKEDFYELYPNLLEDFEEYQKEYAAFSKSVLDKLSSCQPTRQKGFVDSFKDKSRVQRYLDKQVVAGVVLREKKGNAYYISLAK